MQEKSISKLLKQAAYLSKANRTTSAHLSINSLLKHPHFSTLCTIAESLEENLKQANETKASRVINFRKRAVANEMAAPEIQLESEDEMSPDEEVEITESDAEDGACDEAKQSLLQGIDELIEQEIQERIAESRRILSKKKAIVKSSISKAAIKQPMKIKLSRATIEANKKAIR